jgi:hypothetical protein
MANMFLFITNALDPNNENWKEVKTKFGLAFVLAYLVVNSNCPKGKMYNIKSFPKRSNSLIFSRLSSIF